MTSDGLKENLVAVVIGEEWATKSLVRVIGEYAVSSTSAAAAGYAPLEYDKIVVPLGALPWRQESNTLQKAMVRLKTSHVSTVVQADETLVGVIWAPSAEEILLYPGGSLDEESDQMRICCPMIRSEQDISLEQFNPEHAAWCVTQGFEYVYLGDENQDGPQRILHAIGEAVSTCKPAAQSSILLVGTDAKKVARKVESRFPGSTSDLLNIDTKYYSARVRVVIFEEDAFYQSAEALILLADSVEEAQIIWNGLSIAPQTKLLVSTSDSLDEWCLENGFERVLTDESQDGIPRIVQALQCTLWSTMEHKTHGQEVTVLSSSDRNNVYSSSSLVHQDNEDEDDFDNFDLTGDELENIMALVQQARNDAGPALHSVSSSSEDQIRRDRAAQLALRLARSLGLDDDDEDN